MHVVRCATLCRPAGDWGLEGPDGRVALPPTAPAGLEYLNPAGAYVIDNGRIAVLWLGASLHPQFYQQVGGRALVACCDWCAGNCLCCVCCGGWGCAPGAGCSCV